jgi:hypothetical protein
MQAITACACARRPSDHMGSEGADRQLWLAINRLLKAVRPRRTPGRRLPEALLPVPASCCLVVRQDAVDGDPYVEALYPLREVAEVAVERLLAEAREREKLARTDPARR